MYSSSGGQGRKEGQAFASSLGHPSAPSASGMFGSSSLKKRGKDGGGTRLGVAQQQSWDATTYHGLLAILDDSRAPIAASCAAVEECLSLNKDNLRGFFEECFAPLVAKVFGYSGGGYGGGWLSQVSWSSTGSRDEGFRKDHFKKGILMKGGKEQGGSAKMGGSSEMSDAAALRRLLSPQGKLFMAMYNADCDGTIKFHFPRQRLPTCTQLLMNGRGLSMLALWPQYETCLNTQVRGEQQHIHVSVLQYFCYWFAFYAIKGGSGSFDASMSSSRRVLGQLGSKGGGLQTIGKRAADVLHLRGGRSGSGTGKNMYLLLLRDLLHEYLPRPIDSREDEGLFDGHAADHGRAMYSSYQNKPGTGLLLYSILIEFWLKDADERLEDVTPSMRGGNAGGGQRGMMTQKAAWGSSYDPPPENVLEVLEELTKYIMVYQLKDENVPAQSGASWLPLSPVLCQPHDVFNGKAHAGSGAKNILQGPRILGLSGSMSCQAYARQLYRVLHRAFSSWPDQRTIKPLLRVFLAVLAPWQVGAPSSSSSSRASKMQYSTSNQEGATGIKGKMSDLAHMVGLDGQKNSKRRVNYYYTDEWEHHVLSHIPFYLELVPLFLQLSVSRIGARGEASVQDVHKVMSVFEKSEALVSLLREVEQDVNKCYASQPRRAEGRYAELIPWMIDQAENWKQYATSSATHSERKEPGRPRILFSMFSAEIPCAALSANDILCITSGILKADAQKALEKCFVKTLPLTDVHAVGHDADARSAYTHDLADVMKIQRNSWMDVKFKGDPLRAPRTSYEIVYLVDLMIRLSEKLNAKIGLDVPCQDNDIPENIIQEHIYRLRRRHWRINLRPLADIRNVFWTPILLSAIVMITRLVFWGIVIAFQKQ